MATAKNGRPARLASTWRPSGARQKRTARPGISVSLRLRATYLGETILRPVVAHRSPENLAAALAQQSGGGSFAANPRLPPRWRTQRAPARNRPGLFDSDRRRGAELPGG
jgi:hypothetical protein